MSVEKEMKVIIKALNDDPAYLESWKANIAMAFKDEWQEQARGSCDDVGMEFIHKIANRAADRFLDILRRP